jgi:hypothetical protein
MTDLEEADNGQVDEETGLTEATDPDIEPAFLALSQRNGEREDLLQVLGQIIGQAGRKAARGRFKNPAAEQVRIRYLTLAKDTCLAYNAVLKDQQLEDLDRMVTALEGARNAG